MKKIDTSKFRVRPGERVDLKKWPTRVRDFYRDKEDYRVRLLGRIEEMSGLQQRQYADDRYAILLIFQALDAAGKDGMIKHVLSGINPQGCHVTSFKHPSATELDHDFLWRSAQALPERGRIGVFNRSYYEEVLIVRVHPEILSGQKLPVKDAGGEGFWEKRYRSINGFERHLHRNGTRIAKFFLHLSKDEQRKRFLARIDDPERNWKFGSADMKERGFWKEYRKAYAACLEATSTERAPWYVVPADDKQNARLIVAQVVVDMLRSLDLRYPVVSAGRRAELKKLRRLLAA